MADIIILPFAAPDACATIDAERRPIVIDATKLERHGAHAISVTETGTVLLETARPQTNRPWSRSFAR